MARSSSTPPELDFYMVGTIDQENDKMTSIMMIQVMKAYQKSRKR